MADQFNTTQNDSLLGKLAPGRDRQKLRLQLRSRSKSVEFEALPEPFVKVGETVFSHLYLGTMEDADAFNPNVVVVKIQKDTLFGAARAHTNTTAGQALELEAHALGLFAQSQPNPLVQIYRLPRGETVAPLFFCKRVQEYFHPPCPQCGENLRDCKDDDLLQTHGLAGYSDSMVRYLYCAQCSQDSNKVRFYSPGSDNKKPKSVRDRWELIQAFAAQLKNADIADEFP